MCMCIFGAMLGAAPSICISCFCISCFCISCSLPSFTPAEAHKADRLCPLVFQANAVNNTKPFFISLNTTEATDLPLARFQPPPSRSRMSRCRRWERKRREGERDLRMVPQDRQIGHGHARHSEARHAHVAHAEWIQRILIGTRHCIGASRMGRGSKSPTTTRRLS